MTSHLTAIAAVFAILAAASLAYATEVRHDVPAAQAAIARPQVVQLERVIVTAKRLPAGSR